MKISNYMIPDPITANINDSMSDLIYRMKDKNVSHLLIENNDFELVGVVSKEDLLTKMKTLLKVSSGSTYTKNVMNTTTAQEIMTIDPITVSPDDILETVSVIMLERNFHCLPVVENGKAVGIVTYTDLLLGFIGKEYEFPC